MKRQRQGTPVSPFTDLLRTFQDDFRVEPAITEQQRGEAQNIRYRVYCSKLGWEKSSTGDREADAFDSRSVHCLLRHHRSGTSIGCARIVFPDPGRPKHSLPLNNTCASPLTGTIPGITCAEVSRLALLRGYNPQAQTELPLRGSVLAIGLYLGTLHLARLSGVDRLYGLASPALIRQLQRLGFRIEKAGNPVEHRGLRTPYLGDVNRIIEELPATLHPAFDAIGRQTDAWLARHCMQSHIRPRDTPGD